MVSVYIIIALLLSPPCFGQDAGDAASAKPDKGSAEPDKGVAQPDKGSAKDSGGEDNMLGLSFDCKRDAKELCLNNGTCPADGGACACEADFEVFDCSVAIDKSEGACDPPCKNSGTCHSTGGSPVCFCGETYYGANCQKKRVSLKCNPDSMDLSVYPFGEFVGYVYVADQDLDDECHFAKDDEGLFSKTLTFDQCGGAVNETNADGDTELYFAVIVQYDDLVLMETDEELVFLCTQGQSGSDVSWDGDLFNFKKKERNLKRKKISQQLRPVSISMTTADEEPATGPRVLGEELKMTFTFDGGDVYSAFRVEGLVASNGLLGDKQDTLDLITDGCVNPKALEKGLVTDLSGNNTQSVTLSFRAFRIKFSNQVLFKHTVKLCNDGECDALPCDQIDDKFPGIGRRRRHAVSDEVDGDATYETYWTDMRVWYPRDWQGNSQSVSHSAVATHGSSDNTASMTSRDARMKAYGRGTFQCTGSEGTNTFAGCLSNTGFLVFFVCVIVLLLITFIVLVCLCVRLAHHSHKPATPNHSYYDNKSYVG